MPGVIHRPEVRPATSRITRLNTIASSLATSGVTDPAHGGVFGIESEPGSQVRAVLAVLLEEEHDDGVVIRSRGS